MTKCTCEHNKKEHTRTVSSEGRAVSLGCINCQCNTYTEKKRKVASKEKKRGIE